MPPLLQIALGGALGALARYASALAMLRLVGPGFPLGTLAVNIAGSFLMGLAAVAVLARGGEALRGAAPFLMPGLLGGFTTFSAFSLETVMLIERGRAAAAAFYVAASVGGGIAALVLGMWLARGWWSEA